MGALDRENPPPRGKQGTVIAVKIGDFRFQFQGVFVMNSSKMLDHPVVSRSEWLRVAPFALQIRCVCLQCNAKRRIQIVVQLNQSLVGLAR